MSSAAAPGAAPRPGADTLAPHVCGWCGRVTRDRAVQAADGHAGEITWCRLADECQDARDART
ncbi:hypothetical protein [Streptomyces sp. NPDC021224]|uniref:hypothetical protein n=1 Tax=unclassified Streptomyces TaxID=2593676 RepID=UPI003789EBB5